MHESPIEEKDEDEGSPSPIDVPHTNGSAVPAVAPLQNGHATPKSEPKKVDWEIPRKLLHSSIGQSLLLHALLYVMPDNTAFFLGVGTLYLWHSHGSARPVTVALWSALCIIVPADYFRLRYPRFERLYERCLGFLMRESERHQTNGVIW